MCNLPFSTVTFPSVANACFASTGRVVSKVDAAMVSGASGAPSSDNAGDAGCAGEGG
jgi:hypothetical protein